VIGLLNDRIVETGETPDRVVRAVLERIDRAQVGTITVYAGADTVEAEREALVTGIARQFPKASVELQAGEQALYPYIVAVE
jgi:dihydroxyacetone kinase-like predicted kinase